MFIEERHQAILALLNEMGSISTADIQRRFGVGYDSAKRDLRILEEKGLLKRTHGGAISLDQAAFGRGARTAPRDTSDADPERLAIAEYAASLIRENDVIFLQASQEGMLLAQKLSRETHMRVVTNSIPLADLLKKRENASVMLIGGEVDGDVCCFDSFALDMLKRLRFDKCFITSEGLSAGFGLSVGASGRVAFLDGVIGASRRVIGLYRSEKLGADSAISICPAEKLDCVITDRRADADESSSETAGAVSELRECGISVVIADGTGE